MNIWRDTSEDSLPDEVWKPCLSAPDYEVSSLGRVRVMINKFSKNGRHFWVGKIITQNQSSEGVNYLRANLIVDGVLSNFLTHRLVAHAFVLGETELRNQVNHKDGNPKNNLVNNLEWCTALENKAHAIETGLQWYKDGESRSDSKLREFEVLGMLKMYFFDFKTFKEIEQHYNLSSGYASLVISGRRWKKLHSKFLETNAEHCERVMPILKTRNGRNKISCDKLLKEVTLGK